MSPNMNHNLQLVYHLPPHCSSWCSMNTDQAGKAQKSLKITPNTRTDYQSLPKLMLTLSSAPLYEWPWGSDTVNSQTQTPFCCCHHIGCWTTNLRRTRSHKKCHFRIMYGSCRGMICVELDLLYHTSYFYNFQIIRFYFDLDDVPRLDHHGQGIDYTLHCIQLKNTFIHLSKY